MLEFLRAPCSPPSTCVLDERNNAVPNGLLALSQPRTFAMHRRKRRGVLVSANRESGPRRWLFQTLTTRTVKPLSCTRFFRPKLPVLPAVMTSMISKFVAPGRGLFSVGSSCRISRQVSKADVSSRVGPGVVSRLRIPRRGSPD